MFLLLQILANSSEASSNQALGRHSETLRIAELPLPSQSKRFFLVQQFVREVGFWSLVGLAAGFDKLTRDFLFCRRGTLRTESELAVAIRLEPDWIWMGPRLNLILTRTEAKTRRNFITWSDWLSGIDHWTSCVSQNNQESGCEPIQLPVWGDSRH